MKKSLGLGLGLLAICSLVACNESAESVVAPQQQQYQGNQGQGTANNNQVNEDSLRAAIADSIARSMQSSAVEPLSSSMFVFQSSSSAILVQSSSSTVLVQSSSSAVVRSSSSQIVRSSSAVAKSSASVEVDDGTFKLTLWDGSAGDIQVLTGNKTGGWWYSYADDLGSEITWGGPVGDEGDMKDVIEACGGVCGDYVIGEGDPDDGVYPYLGFAFGYANKANITGDASAMKGICVTYSYSGTATFAIELGLTTAQENALGSALPMVELAKGTKKTMDFLWTDFEQPEWATKKMTGKTAAAQLSSIKFKFADATGGESGTFNVIKVGPYGGCD